MCSKLVLTVHLISDFIQQNIIQAMNIHNCNFLSDCQQQVHFLNRDDLSNPPDWRSKPYTQDFSNNAAGTSSTITKINRQINTTADTLARQAFASSTLELESHRSFMHCAIDVNIFATSCC